MLVRSWCLTQFFKYKRKCIKEIVSRACQQRCCSSKPSVLFFGTDNFSLPSLQQLHKNKSSSGSELGVVTSFKSPANCIRLYAEKQQLPLFRWPVDSSVCQQYDLGVVVSFGHLIPERIIKAFPNGMINVHASLLPRWRGAAPIIYALMHGDASTGVTIMKVEPKHFDVGDILAQREVAIKENILMPELHQQLAKEGSLLLLDVVRNFEESSQKAKKQNDAEASFAPKITPAVAEVPWSELSSREVYNRYRALYGFKNLTTHFEGKQVQLVEIRLPAEAPESLQLGQPGSFVYSKARQCLVVQCAQNTQIEVHQLRLEGKKIMGARDFCNGFLKKLQREVFLFAPPPADPRNLKASDCT